MVCLWSLRLASHLFVRVKKAHPTEDSRYRELREGWARSGFKLFLFFEAQALLAVWLSVPFLLICFNAAPRIDWLEWTAYGLWLIALAGEALSDAQLKRFKLNPANRGKVCEVGCGIIRGIRIIFLSGWCGALTFCLRWRRGRLSHFLRAACDVVFPFKSHGHSDFGKTVFAE